MLSTRSLLIQGSIFRCHLNLPVVSFRLSTSVQAAWNKRKSPMACNQRLQLLPSWKLKERQNVRHPMGIERISWKDIIRHTKKTSPEVLRFPYIKLPDMSGFWIRTAKTNCWWLYLLPMINQHCGALEAWPKIPKKKPNKNHPSTLGMQKFEEGKFHQEAKWES